MPTILTQDQFQQRYGKVGLSKFGIEPTSPSRSQETLQDITQTGKSIASRFKTGLEEGREIKESDTGFFSKQLQKAGVGADVISGSIGDIFTGIIKGALSQDEEEAVKTKVAEVTTAVISNPTVSQSIKSSISNFQQLEPKTQKNLESVFNLAMLGLDVAGLGLTGKGAKIGIKSGKKGIETGFERSVQAGTKLVGKTKEVLSMKTGVEKVAQTISPKLTSKEIKTALRDGRVVRSGTLAKLFGKADDVILDRRVNEAAQTITTRIPGADKLSDQQIAIAVKNEIAGISKGLEPKLRKIKLVDETKDNILNSFADIKQAQLDDAVFNSSGIITKQQKRFEDILVDLVDADNADELWKLVQQYDNTVKSNIKEATHLSSDSAQELKDVWLENRRILRDALDDVADSIDDVGVSTEFKAMTGLYTARQNIINSAKFAKSDKELLRKILTRIGLGGAAVLGFKMID